MPDLVNSSAVPTDFTGTGAYEVKRYSVVLRYAHGRVERVALTTVFGAEPTGNNDILFFHRGQFSRRRNGVFSGLPSGLPDGGRAQ